MADERLHSESSNTRPVDIVIAEHCGDFQIFTSPELQPDTHTRSHTHTKKTRRSPNTQSDLSICLSCYYLQPPTTVSDR